MQKDRKKPKDSEEKGTQRIAKIQEKKEVEEKDTRGFPDDVDFKKFLGCGG